MDAGQTMQWAKDQLAGATDYDLLRPLGSVMLFGTGAHYRAGLERHLKDRRRTVVDAFRDLIGIYDAPDKLERIRAQNQTLHPSDLVDIVRDSKDPKLETTVPTNGQGSTLRTCLEQGEPGLDLLRQAFPSIGTSEQNLVAKWVLMARCMTTVEFALDHVFDGAPNVRYQSRQFLKKYDLMANCLFLAR